MVIQDVMALAQKTTQKHPEIRRGQAIFNSLYILAPDIADALRGSEVDCFHQDIKILPFLAKAKELLEEKS